MKLLEKIENYLIDEGLHLDKGEMVRIIGHLDADNKDLYKIYPWFKSAFPDEEEITGRVYSYNIKDDEYMINFETKNHKKFGHGSLFTGDQIEFL